MKQEHSPQIHLSEKPNGVLNLDKPSGISSARAVALVKKLLPRGTKVGHAGTLDPFATGVLLILCGRATKACEQLMHASKQYIASVKLGAYTETDDLEAPEQPVAGAQSPTLHQIHGVLGQFIGKTQQQPPAYSALKVGGQRAYHLARQGQAVSLQARTVRIDALDLIHFEWPTLEIRVDCGRGTYIRSLARDIGAALGTGGYLTALRRTRIGTFHVEQSVSLNELDPTTLHRRLQPVESVL